MHTNKTISIRINGQQEFISIGQTLAQFMTNRFEQPADIIVELNGQIIPRDSWNITSLQSQDCLELVHFVGGG